MVHQNFHQVAMPSEMPRIVPWNRLRDRPDDRRLSGTPPEPPAARGNRSSLMFMMVRYALGVRRDDAGRALAFPGAPPNPVEPGAAP